MYKYNEYYYIITEYIITLDYTILSGVWVCV